MSVKKYTTEGVLSYDIDNAYPNRIETIISASGRATSCTNEYSRFIRGTGFEDPGIAGLIVNRKKETLNKILRKLSIDQAKFRNGYALHFNFNAAGQIVEINHVQYSSCRYQCDQELRPTGKIAYFTDWGREQTREIRKDKIKILHAFNPDPEIIMAQAEEAGGFDKYLGQILYHTETPGKYSLAICDSVIEDVLSDAEAKQFRLNNISTNFLASQIFITDKMDSDDEREEFGDSLRRHQGARNAAKILHIERTNPNQTFELKKTDIQDVDGLFSMTETSVKESIRGVYMIPPVLIGDLVSGKLGTSQEIKDATAFYNGITEDDRMVNSELMAEILPKWHQPIENPNTNIKPVQTNGL
jgi:hypothetical protein